MLLACVAFASAAAPAPAAIFDVDRTIDSLGGGCTAAPNDCSLREAISGANGSPGSTVVIPSGTFTLTLGGAPDDLNLAGDLDMSQSTTITGAGAGATIIQASGRADRVFQVNIGNPSAISSLSGVTITGGGGVSDGAGIQLNGGTLSITGTTIDDNVISTGSSGGAGIYVPQGTLNIESSTISNNSVTNGEGGGIYTGQPVTLNIQNSTVSGNSTSSPSSGGGGIYNQDALLINNSTIAGNSSTDEGGGVVNSGGATTTIRSSTISGNSSGISGGGVINYFGSTLRLENSIISGNSGPAGKTNCGTGLNGVITSDGHNLEDSNTCTLAAAGDLPNTNAQLGSLTNNGGPTRTMALPFGSPAIHAGNAATCPATDQRGKPRAAGCDIGAFQYVDEIAPTVADLKLSPRSFKARRSGASVAAARRRVASGATASFTLSEAASVRFTVERLTKGHRVRGKCKPRRRRGKRCTIIRPVSGDFRVQGVQGANSFKFTGRLNGRRLKPGDYRLVGTPTDAAGIAGTAVNARFKIAR